MSMGTALSKLLKDSSVVIISWRCVYEEIHNDEQWRL